MVEDLWRMDGWYEGVVDLPPGRWGRWDPSTGLLCELTQGSAVGGGALETPRLHWSFGHFLR